MKLVFALVILFALTLSAGLALTGPGAPRAETIAGISLAQADTKPMERTTTEASPVAPHNGLPNHIVFSFSCNDKQCWCKGQDSCFDLGSKGVCGGGTSGLNCKADNSCTCDKKAQ